jgi:hypothetical protein
MYLELNGWFTYLRGYYTSVHDDNKCKNEVRWNYEGQQTKI